MSQWSHTVFLTDGRTIGPEKIDTTYRNDNGWLAVKLESGAFRDYPPNMVQEVHRELPEES